MAQLNESHGRVKAPPITDDVKVLRNYLANLADMYAKLAKDLDFIINGNLDVKNIRAHSITAEAMKVDELSAISANLGHIIAGLIETVTMIGSLIMTDQPGNYPRSEMSNTDKMFKAEGSATRHIQITPLTTMSGGSAPGLAMKHESNELTFGYDATVLGGFGLYVNGTLDIQALNGVYLTKAMVPSWSTIENYFAGRTLEQELTEIRNSISALTTVVNGKADSGESTSSAGSHNHGIAPGTELVTTTGTVTWGAAPAHSHTQN